MITLFVSDDIFEPDEPTSSKDVTVNSYNLGRVLSVLDDREVAKFFKGFINKWNGCATSDNVIAVIDELTTEEKKEFIKFFQSFLKVLKAK